MVDKVPLDYMDVEYIPCCCGCGEEANVIYKGVPVPWKNGMSHYKSYKVQERELDEEETC